MNRIILQIGDITKLKIDCIVNAANKTLLGGGGVDGAIHKAAGKDLYEYCQKLNGADTGEAKITPGFKLAAKYVIHTVGPRKTTANKEIKLHDCYRNSLLLAEKNGIKEIAFPCISTGVYGYPFEEACQIALTSISETLKETNISKVYLICFSEYDFKRYEEIMKNFNLD